MPRLSYPFALARGVLLSPMWIETIVASTRVAVSMCQLQLPSVGIGRNNFSGYTQAVADVVSSHVVRDESKDRRQCLGCAADSGAGKLQDGVELVAQTAPGDGATGAGQTHGPH